MPNAAYRHFASRHELRQVRAVLAVVAAAMETELDKVKDVQGEEGARAALRAVGTGYMRFALTETGLFRMVLPPRPTRSTSRTRRPRLATAASIRSIGYAVTMSVEVT